MLERGNDEVSAILGGKYQDFGRRVLAKLPYDVETVETRQAEIENEDVRTEFVDSIEDLESVAYFGNDFMTA
jgi:hypothetical protein